MGVDVARLWQQSTVTAPHACDGPLAGRSEWYVVWRGEGVHVSVPASAKDADLARLSGIGVSELRDLTSWAELADEMSLAPHVPEILHVLDEDPGVPDSVEQVDPIRLTQLRRAVDDQEWSASHLDRATREGCVAVALWSETGSVERSWVPELLGAAVLTDHAGARRDLGVLVATHARGRGFGRLVGQAAASYAVAWHGWATWHCRADDDASLHLGRSIGFEPYATRLVLTPTA
jgi:GNAT superfamily N-acetyltransferase